MLFSWPGLLAGFAAGLILIAVTKTLSGHSYLYPLFPFHWKSLKTNLQDGTIAVLFFMIRKRLNGWYFRNINV